MVRDARRRAPHHEGLASSVVVARMSAATSGNKGNNQPRISLRSSGLRAQDAPPPEPPQPEIPTHAGSERKAKRNRGAEQQGGDMQHRDRDAKSHQAPAAIGDQIG